MGLVYLPTIWLNFMVYVGKYTVRPMGYGKWVDLPARSSFVRFQGCKFLLLKMEVSHLECSIGDTVDGQNPAPVDR